MQQFLSLKTFLAHVSYILWQKRKENKKKIKEKKTFQVKKNRNDVFNRVLC